MINKGYYIKARCIMESDIMSQPPYVREVWDWLLMNANHADGKSSGRCIRRGQLFVRLDDIRAGLSWYVGYRKESYTKDHMKKAMKALKKASMITTDVSTRGVVITISNYGMYQDPKNYESSNESTNESSIKAPSKHQTSTTINKNSKNSKNEKINIILPNWIPIDAWNAFIEMRINNKSKPTEKAMQMLINKLGKLNDAGYDPLEVLEQSTMNNYKGLFEVKQNGRFNNNQQPTIHDNITAGIFGAFD